MTHIPYGRSDGANCGKSRDRMRNFSEHVGESARSRNAAKLPRSDSAKNRASRFATHEASTSREEQTEYMLTAFL
jgi:hypothetical protein